MAWDNNVLNPRKGSFVTVVITVLLCCEVGGRWAVEGGGGGGPPYRILLDSDVLTDDLFAYFYLLKLNQSEFSVKGITINANTWTDAGHSVNQVYDILYMMDRDDIPVGIGGEGAILQNDTIEPNVGGYLPLIEQGIGTAGYCRYRQHIPVGRFAGRLDINTNYGHRKEFLPRGKRQYSPLKQPTAQQVMIDTISAGPTIVFIMASPTNFAIFLMRNPHLKKNVKHIYMMGGGIRSKNPSGCCPKNATSCPPSPCGTPGNLITYTSNPYAEYNIFGDPFATYQVIHSGIPITLIPLDATNTIPINKEFFDIFEKNQHTYEAQYCFKSLKTVRDTWVDENFYTSYFMWDSFTAGIATSIMKKPNNVNGENEFAEMEYLNITVVTSNEPYGISDGSNPFFDGHKIPRFNLQRNGVHSGHVQTGLRDPFCQGGRCKDAYTPMVTGPESVQVLVAVKAKPNKDKNSPLNREFFKSFLDVVNSPLRSGRFNSTTQFPFHREVLHKPNLKNKKHGTNVVFDMDMSPGDFLALVFLLKLPVEKINLKAIFVTPTGWATAATIDIVYDLLHMMGRDDIPVGLGEVYAMNQSDPNFPVLGDCKYNKVIPSGSGGYLDSDTLYGLARNLPRSPRRYTAENSVKYGAPRDTEHPELRQPLALEIWNSVVKSLDPGSKLTILTNGPLSTLANIILSSKNTSYYIEELIIVGGHIHNNNTEKGNVINFPSNKYAELNMFLDPLAAKVLFNSGLNITLVPLDIQRKFSTFPGILQKLYLTKKTPEVLFATSLLSRMDKLRRAHPRYKHMDTFLGEILGAIVLGDADESTLGLTFATENIDIHANGIETEDGQMTINEHNGRSIRVLKNIRSDAFYDSFAAQLGKKEQSAVVANFDEQRRLWSTPNQNGMTPYNRGQVQKKIPSRSKTKKFDGVQD